MVNSVFSRKDSSYSEWLILIDKAQSAGATEYIDCTPAER